MDTRNIITVQERQTHEVAASSADLSVTVEGLSLFGGAEALKKAQEVAQLVADLTAFGLPQEAIFLQSVSADVHTGTLTKNSRARYRLRIHCADLSKLADLVGIVTAQKNTTLNGTTWGYPDDDTLHDDWLMSCIARVNEKSAKIAAALGVHIVGIAAFSEALEDPEAARPRRGAASDDGSVMMRAARVTSEELGLEISHTKTVFVTVKADFLVSGREADTRSAGLLLNESRGD